MWRKRVVSVFYRETGSLEDLSGGRLSAIGHCSMISEDMQVQAVGALRREECRFWAGLISAGPETGAASFLVSR